MNFSIKCETFVRLASVCNFFESSTSAEVKEKINTVRLENKDGKCIAIVTNEKIAVMELLSNTDQPDGHIHLVLDEKLITQCKTEMTFNSNLHITAIPEIATASAKTDLGYSHDKNCCYWFDDSPLNNWFKWIPVETVVKSTGQMYWDVYQIETLVNASPSGKIAFPEYIDSEKPIILRDCKSSDWLGLFIPEPENPTIHKHNIEEWWKNEK